MTAPFILTYPLEGWQPIDVFEAIPYLLDKIKGQYDVLILLSHLGITVDEKLRPVFQSLMLLLVVIRIIY